MGVVVVGKKFTWHYHIRNTPEKEESSGAVGQPFLFSAAYSTQISLVPQEPVQRNFG